MPLVCAAHENHGLFFSVSGVYRIVPPRGCREREELTPGCVSPQSTGPFCKTPRRPRAAAESQGSALSYRPTAWNASSVVSPPRSLLLLWTHRVRRGRAPRVPLAGSHLAAAIFFWSAGCSWQEIRHEGFQQELFTCGRHLVFAVYLEV